MRSAAVYDEGVARVERPGPAAREKRRICFVAPRLWPVISGDFRAGIIGGAEMQQGMLIRLLQRAGYPISAVTLDFGQPPRADARGVTVHKTCREDEGIPVLRFLHPRLTTTWRALKEADADIYYVRAASILVGIVAAFCRRYGRRSVYAAASDADFIPGHRQIRFARDRMIYEHGLRTVDHIVVQNELQLELCQRNFGRGATLIPSCYELPERRERAPRDVVLWVGRVCEGKGPELFLELARRLPQRRFVLVGPPALGSEAYFRHVRARAAALPNVEMTGFLPPEAAEAWFDHARVLVNTSDYEGMPNTFLQAWARGVPTVATVDVGAPVQIVFKDAEEGAARIERLFADAAAWGARSRACQEYFERVHSSDAVLARYERVFASLERDGPVEPSE